MNNVSIPSGHVTDLSSDDLHKKKSEINKCEHPGASYFLKVSSS